MWEGKQILPASWIEGVRAGQRRHARELGTADLRYGSQFWVMPKQDAYLAVGYHRQLIVVMPKLDIVAVATGASRFSIPSGTASSPRYGLGTLVGYLAAAVTSDGAIAADPAATAELAERVKQAALEKPAPAAAGLVGAGRRRCPARPGGSPAIRRG